MAKTARRDAGAGALYQRSSDGMWIASVTLPDDPVTGKRRRKVVSARTQAAASDKLRKLRADLDKSGDLPTSSPSVERWMALWLKRHAPKRVRPRTLSGYQSYVNQYIVPALGKHRLEKLTPDHVSRLAEHIEGKGLSSTTALQAHRILSRALKDAVRVGLVTRNVADKDYVDAPKRAVSTRRALTAKEAIKLLQSVASDPYGGRWALGLLTGMRAGECLGLKGDMVDLKTGRITVARQLQRLTWEHGCDPKCRYVRAGSCPDRKVDIPPGVEAENVEGGLWLLELKTDSSYRTVPMAAQLWEIMRRLQPGDGFVWGIVDPREDHDRWHEALSAAGLPRVPLHSLRHTTSTLLRTLGVDEQMRMEILGHSSAPVTRGYTHVDDEEMRAAADALGALVYPQIGS